jgi:hypothetical protein
MRKSAAVLAIVFGLFLTWAETARNWGNWQYWPFWLVDYIAAALLLIGGVMALRRARAQAAFLSAAWGFTTSMFYGSFWSHVRDQAEKADGNLAQGPLTVVIGVMWVFTIVGFVLSLLAARTSDAQAS